MEVKLYRSVIGLKNRCRYNCQDEVVKQQTTSIPVYIKRTINIMSNVIMSNVFLVYYYVKSNLKN